MADVNTNHSDIPNAEPVRHQSIFASRTIEFVSKGTEIFEDYRQFGHSTWAKDCSSFLNPELDRVLATLETEAVQHGPMDIVLTQEQVNIYLQSRLDTPVQKALLTCLKEFGVYQKGVYRIPIPDCETYSP
ncbi:hypothetical protein BGZ83_000551 [Gryganskiella cystojenkinii]|nr:hypothetical protein BGZ83_000551 [Gryganskiella cystojenkinii]